MKSFVSITALAGVAASVVAATAPAAALTALCPQLDGQKIADNAGTRYSVSCDWKMDADGQVEVEGPTSPLICMEACEEAESCYSVNISPDGSCKLISGKEKGMASSAGSINLYRLQKAATTSTSRVQITKTWGAVTSSSKSSSSSVPRITTTRKATTSTSTRSTTSRSTSSAISTPSAATNACQLTSNNLDLCPACDDKVALDLSGKAYHIYCDSSLFTNGTYSVQEALTPEGCLQQCNDLSFCKGVSYYDDRNCEIAKGPEVWPTAEAGYTAFLPVASSAATPTVKTSSLIAVRSTSVKSPAANKTTSSIVPDATFSILPISTGCSTDALTCPQCDGFSIDDQLNQTYSALCDFAPVCDSTAIMTGPTTQEQCMQSCDQDATCLAVLWYASASSCHLCQQGLDGGPGVAQDFILLVADIDGDDDNTTAAPTSSSTSISTATFTTETTTTTRTTSTVYVTASYSSGTLKPPAPYSSGFARSTTSTTAELRVTASSSPIPTAKSSSSHLSINPGGPIQNTTRSASVPNISAVVCPGLGEGVFVDPTDFNFFEVMCDSIFTAAHSRYTSASDFADCVASCTSGCDGVQFGYTTRCGLYTDISIVGPGAGWTIAASLTYPDNTALPFSTSASTTSTTTS